MLKYAKQFFPAGQSADHVILEVALQVKFRTLATLKEPSDAVIDTAAPTESSNTVYTAHTVNDYLIYTCREL